MYYMEYRMGMPVQDDVHLIEELGYNGSFYYFHTEWNLKNQLEGELVTIQMPTNVSKYYWVAEVKAVLKGGSAFITDEEFTLKCC